MENWLIQSTAQLIDIDLFGVLSIVMTFNYNLQDSESSYLLHFHEHKNLSRNRASAKNRVESIKSGQLRLSSAYFLEKENKNSSILTLLWK